MERVDQRTCLCMYVYVFVCGYGYVGVYGLEEIGCKHCSAATMTTTTETDGMIRV